MSSILVAPIPALIDTWRISLLELAPRRRDLEKLLNPVEQARVTRFVFDHDQERFAIARGALRTVLGHYLSVPPATIGFNYGPHGKPSVQECTLEFNLSHAADWAYLAISKSAPVGIDVERLRVPARHGWLDLARRFFSASEVAELTAMPLDKQTEAFFACWTRKEAYIKLHGRGLSLPLAQFSVSTAPDSQATLRTSEWLPGDVSRTAMHDLSAPQGYRACVAAGTESSIIVCQRQWADLALKKF
ncbi:MAG: 4'-phosphopantetheinyl transferase superfamily protein [Arenicellales bacterium]